MEDRRRTRSQGLSEGSQLIQWDSLQDPVRIEREQAEVHRRAREANTVTNMNENAVENSEISQPTEGQPRFTDKVPRLGEISPNQLVQEGQMNVTPKSGEIFLKRREENNPQQATENRGEISPKEPDEVTDLMAMEEGAVARTPSENTRSKLKGEKRPREEENLLNKSPQIDTAQHYLIL